MGKQGKKRPTVFQQADAAFKRYKSKAKFMEEAEYRPMAIAYYAFAAGFRAAIRVMRRSVTPPKKASKS